MTTAHQVLARYLGAATSKEAVFDVEAFAKFHPVYNVVTKERRIGDKAMSQALRFAEFAAKADRYKGDPSRIQPNLDKAFQAVQALVASAGRVLKATDSFISEYGKDLSSDYRKNVLGDLVKWYKKLEADVQEVTSDETYRASLVGESWTVSMFLNKVSKMHANFTNLTASTEMAAKIRLAGPGPAAPDASPEDRFKAFKTRDIISMAKACAKKLGGKVAPCAALGLDVMEDVNSHKEQATVQGMLDHYVKEVTEDEYGGVRGLVSKVSGAIDWGIVDAGAFLVAILEVCHAPEAGRVQDTLAKAYAQYTD